MAFAKLVLGYATGAVSVLSDGFHSLTDSASNIVGSSALRAARKPPDDDHPYGHRKFETLAAAGIFVFLLLVVVEVVRAALSRLGRRRAGAGHRPQLRRHAGDARRSTSLVVRYEAARGRAAAAASC